MAIGAAELARMTRLSHCWRITACERFLPRMNHVSGGRMMIPLCNVRRLPLVGGVALLLTVLFSGAVGAQSSAASVKRDSVARADSVAKAKKKKQADDQAAAKKAADAKTAAAKTAAAKTAAAKQEATKQEAAKQALAKEAAAKQAAAKAPKPGSSAPTDSKPASGTAKPVAAGTPKASAGRGKAPAKPATAASEQGRTSLADDGPAIGVYVGASSAGLGFGTAPVVGVGIRLAAPTASLRLRGELMGAHYSQTAPARAGGPVITDRASLTHVGAALSLVLNLSSSRSMRPYIVIGGGVFRFQATGQAGSNGAIVNGVFASTTDVAGIGGVGLQLTPRFIIEARYLTVGDFHTVPITVGVRF